MVFALMEDNLGTATWATLPKAFNGRRVFIVGGGPSVNGINWERLRGKTLLVCNAAMFLLPDGVAEWGIFGDKGFLNLFREQVRRFAHLGGFVINATGRPLEDKNWWLLNVKRQNGRPAWGIIPKSPRDRSPTTLPWNRSTGGTAIAAAVEMGANELVLIGFDMRVGSNGKHNWHSEYQPYYDKTKPGWLPNPPKSHYKDQIMRPFPRIAEDLAKLEIPCWNTFSGSELRVFPYRSLEDLL